MGVEFAYNYWKSLEHGIQNFLNQNTIGRSLEEFYRDAFNRMRYESGEQLYSGLAPIMTSQLEETAMSLEDHEGPLFLGELVREWTTFITALDMINIVFMYMDKTFIPRTQKTSVHELGLDLWRDIFVQRIKIQERLKYALPELVQRERRGQVINRDLMRNSVKMLLSFRPRVYENVFHAPLLLVSNDFYRDQSQLLIKSFGCGDYLKETEKRLSEEIERVSNYMDRMTERHLINIVVDYMIQRHVNKLAHMKNSAFVGMLMDDKYEDLARMYALFKRTLNGLGVIRKGIAAHIRNIGTQLTEPGRLNDDPMDFVQRLLDERDKYDKIINRAFNNDKMFQDDVNSSFEHFINLNPQVPEFISLFVDKKLREGLKGVSEEEVEIVLDKVMRLFRYLKEKDIFKKHYRQHFVKRLLSNTSVSEDAERSLILKLKTECGSEFTSKLELMFTNMKASDDTIKQFYEAMGHEFEDGPTLAAHIRDIGRQLVTDPERLKDPVDLVQRILDERDKCNKIINLAFNNDKMFQDVFNSSFEHFINLNPRVPEFISLFVDEKLRGGLKGASKEEVEIVDKVMRLFRYLKEKDIFEKHYKQHLLKRLLANTSVSEDAERSLISKLKTECGSQFTSKLEGMFTDVKSSGDTMKQFYEAKGHELGDGPTLAARVLKTESWLTQSTTTCNLPSEILTVADRFKAYYIGTHNRRKMTWQTNMGSADIIATFSNGQKHELHVSTQQMCVLMLFNSGDGLSYKDIEKATNISTSDLKRCLQSLACIKGKNVLTKEPKSKDIGEDDMFFFNDKFSSKFDKVDVGTMVEFEFEKETRKRVRVEFEKETRKRVKVDGKHQIDAAIVRIMKAQRALDHSKLVAEVTKKLESWFSPDRAEIKERIESLIDREFLKRDKDNSELYRYVVEDLK